MTGKITAIIDHGSIVTVGVTDPSTRAYRAVNFDHAPFRWLVEARGGVSHILGETVTVHVDAGAEYITFDDEEIN